MLPAKKLISEALQLKLPQKLAVIEALINNIDEPYPKIEEQWAIEAEKRLKAYKKGKLKTIPFEDMFRENK